MQLGLNETLSFFNSQLNTYYSLWVFFFTASIGIAGFLYGNNFARDSLLVKFSATIIYFMLVIGNHHAISTTNNVLKEVKASIQSSCDQKVGQSGEQKVDLRSAINLLQDNSVNLLSRIKSLATDIFYLIIVLFVFAAIWLPGVFLNQQNPIPQ